MQTHGVKTGDKVPVGVGACFRRTSPAFHAGLSAGMGPVWSWSALWKASDSAKLAVKHTHAQSITYAVSTRD